MSSPSPKSERLAGIILIGLLLSAITIGGGWFFLEMQNESKNIPIEKAMYVSDWNITKIYGPGTPQQAKIVEQFKARGSRNLEFGGYVLYRMPNKISDTFDEGILLLGFDPKNPKSTLQLKTEP